MAKKDDVEQLLCNGIDSERDHACISGSELSSRVERNCVFHSDSQLSTNLTKKKKKKVEPHNIEK